MWNSNIDIDDTVDGNKWKAMKDTKEFSIKFIWSFDLICIRGILWYQTEQQIESNSNKREEMTFYLG